MGHEWLLCVRLALFLLNSLFWVVLRKAWVEALTWIAAKVVWRVVLVVEVPCAAGMIEV